MNRMTKGGLKTMLYSYREMSYDEWELLKIKLNNFESIEDREELEKDMILLGGFGLND